MHECDERTRTILRRLTPFKTIFTGPKDRPALLSATNGFEFEKQIYPAAHRQLQYFWALYVLNNVLKIHTQCLENEYVGRGKWTCIRRQDSSGKSNLSKTLRGIGASGVNRVLKKWGSWKRTDQFSNRSVNPKKLDIFRSVSLLTCFFISVFIWSNVSNLEISSLNHKVLHVS